MFCITATFSLFAYIWLVIVLVVSSPNKVDVWEAVLTFLFFPLLVCIAYAGDKGFLNKLLGVKKTEAGEAPEQVELGEGKNPPVDIPSSPHFLTAQPMLEKETVSCGPKLVGLLKKIRRNKSLSEDEVAQQAAKAVREDP